MPHKCVTLISCQESCWEHDSMERNVVFSHELIKAYIDTVGFPPLFEFLVVLLCNTEITKRSIKPHIEDLVSIAIQWYWYSPF